MDDPALSAAQLKSQLWADDRVQVYAVLMGTRVPDLPDRLAQAQSARLLPDFDCLRPGALPAAARREAPYLAWLQRDSAFTDWLLFEAAVGLGDWGVVATGAAPLLAMRSHLRSLLAAQMPGGPTIAIDWMDPVILQALLPLFDPAGLTAFFGPAQALVVPGSGAWKTFTAPLGRLDLRNATLAKSS